LRKLDFEILADAAGQQSIFEQYLHMAAAFAAVTLAVIMTVLTAACASETLRH
jgi:hypothetical protein